MNLATRIRQRMSDLKLTQEALANRADLSQGMVYKLVSGKSKSTTKIVELAHALECSIEWLATGKTSEQTSNIMEDRDLYEVDANTHINRLKSKIRALPVRDQKALALEIMNELLDKG